MADEATDEAEKERLAEEARRQLEEFQRQQAEQQVAASQGQPNAVPNEDVAPAVSRVTDYTSRGLPTTGGNEPIPGATPGVPLEGPALSPQEQQFWAANPLGAVVDQQTGSLVGLGDRNNVPVNAGIGPPATRYSEQNRVNEGLGPPAISGQGLGQEQVPQRLQAPVFNPNDFKNPIYQNRLIQLSQEIADSNRKISYLSPYSTGKGQHSPRDQEISRLKVLTQAYAATNEQMHRDAQEGFQFASKNLELQQRADHANSGSEVMQFMSGLPRDPAERQQAWLSELAKPERVGWIEAINHNPELGGLVKASIQGQQTAAEQQAAIQELAGGRTVTLKGGSAKTPTFTIQPNLSEATTAETQKEITKSLAGAGITPEQFAQRNKVEQGNVDEKTKAFTNDTSGTHMRVTIGNQQFAVPVEKYNQLNAAIPAAQQAAPAATQTDPRAARAQQALSDPNASEAAKAQARKILGVQ